MKFKSFLVLNSLFSGCEYASDCWFWMLFNGFPKQFCSINFFKLNSKGEKIVFIEVSGKKHYSISVFFPSHIPKLSRGGVFNFPEKRTIKVLKIIFRYICTQMGERIEEKKRLDAPVAMVCEKKLCWVRAGSLGVWE